jgi:hypothetical protein
LAEACPDCPFLSADYESPTLASSSETSSPAWLDWAAAWGSIRVFGWPLGY